MQGVAGSSPVSPRKENTFFHWLEECVFSVSGVKMYADFCGKGIGWREKFFAGWGKIMSTRAATVCEKYLREISTENA